MSEDDFQSGRTRPQNDRSPDADATDPSGNSQQTRAPSFKHNGIGSSILLTAAAAIVPMIIVGVAAVNNLTGRGGTKGGRR